MKTKRQKSTSPNPRIKRSRNRWINAIYLIGFALSLAVVLALFSLLVVGLPPPVTKRITRQFEHHGVPIQVESIRLSLHHGWVLKNARLYSSSPDDLSPLLHANKLYVMLWPVDWEHPMTSGWHMNLRVKNLDISLGRPWETVITDSHPFRTINHLEASLLVTPEQITLDQAQLVWGNINIAIQGTTIFKQGDPSPSQRGEDFRRQAAQAVDAISQLKCTPSPQ
ncbi:MAG: hypothetical protein FJ220_05165, partial [Kiritimatiellaceae bacterium]|nr:hypothetical protein [Kiritimatiellaceae bacterium]